MIAVTATPEFAKPKALLLCLGEVGAYLLNFFQLGLFYQRLQFFYFVFNFIKEILQEYVIFLGRRTMLLINSPQK